jgi:hypothetical protein
MKPPQTPIGRHNVTPHQFPAKGMQHTSHPMLRRPGIVHMHLLSPTTTEPSTAPHGRSAKLQLLPPSITRSHILHHTNRCAPHPSHAAPDHPGATHGQYQSAPPSELNPSTSSERSNTPASPARPAPPKPSNSSAASVGWHQPMVLHSCWCGMNAHVLLHDDVLFVCVCRWLVRSGPKSAGSMCKG